VIRPFDRQSGTIERWVRPSEASLSST